MITSMEKIYYTYAYLRLDGTPYYIGRGCGRRAYRHHGRRIRRPSRDRILLLKTGLSFADSVRHEIYMISIFGRKDNGTGVLHNLTDGGEGVPGSRHSAQTKKHLQRRLKEAWSSGRHQGSRGKPGYDRNGEKNHKSRITDEQRREIAATWVPGNRNSRTGNGRELAEKYGLNIESIRQIAKDPRWTS